MYVRILGSINTGIGYTKLNKFLTSIDVPCMSTKTYKKYYNEVAPSAVAAVQESSPNLEAAVEEERQDETVEVQASEELSEI